VEINKVGLVSAMIGRELSSARERSTGFVEGQAQFGAEALQVSDLKVGFRVKNGRVSVKAGEIVGLAGLLGSGRTELARAVFGADVAEAGEIRLFGEKVTPRDPSEAIARGVGFCSEDRKVEGIVPDMSVAENLTLGVLPKLTRLGIVDEAERRQIVARFIKRLAIKTSNPDQKIRELSGGNQQKVLLARWLCANTRLLILDEPTRGIDVGAKADASSCSATAAPSPNSTAEP
jgi:ribose transport system ATP-binding protein